MALKIIVDLVLVAIIIGGVILGLKKGFTKIVARPVKLIASLVLAFSFCSGFGESIIAPIIDAPIQGYLSNFLYENCASITAENVTEELPTLVKIAAAAFGIDIEQIAAGAAVNAILDEIILNITSPVISLISTVLGFIAVYLLSRLGFAIAFLIIDLVFNGGLLGAINKLLGLIFGTAFAFIIAWGLAVVLELIFNLPAFASNEFISNYEGGWLYNFFNTFNPMELLLSF